jgi:hypothetical protein
MKVLGLVAVDDFCADRTGPMLTSGSRGGEQRQESRLGLMRVELGAHCVE